MRILTNDSPMNAGSPLRGKTAIFLGSSVTEGSAACGRSFVERLVAEDGIVAVKEAVPGTTLAGRGADTYTARLKNIPAETAADVFVCQLSTNDAGAGSPLGEAPPAGTGRFDIDTVAGAIGHIIDYARRVWQCPVVFYTGTRFDSARYAAMVSLLLQIQKLWDIGVLDLWNSERMNAVAPEEYRRYMHDPIHPNAEGYRLWWTPVFREYLTDFLKG